MIYLRLAIVLLFSVSAYSAIDERKLYVGVNSTEAVFKFEARVDLKKTSGQKLPEKETVLSIIEDQLQHLYGPMSIAKYKSVPRGDHEIKIDWKNIILKKSGFFSIPYTYTGTIVVDNGPRTKYEIIVPINPKKVYEDAFVSRDGLQLQKSPCTDEHYQTLGDFWYFWNPFQAGCDLKEAKNFFDDNGSYVRVTGTITRTPNSRLSYPEYQKLIDPKTKTVSIHVFFGLDEEKHGKNPMTSKDANAENFRLIRENLIGLKYTSHVWEEEDLRDAFKYLQSPLPYVETMSKVVGDITLEVRLYYGPTGIDEKSRNFHKFYKDALENSSIMIYGGHSGLGGHLDLDAIEGSLKEKIHFNKNKYQIYFFDSCTSYSYYNTQYFARKRTENDPRGTKNLDIMTNGLATYFYVMPEATGATIQAVEQALNYYIGSGVLVSYQDIAASIDSNNLFGINGDEDNATPAK